MLVRKALQLWQNSQDEATINYPTACDGAISVGALNSADGISGYSNQNAYVDIAAPLQLEMVMRMVLQDM